MEDRTATHAMTEIALALAMAFFALMILTLVSLGAGVPSKTSIAQQREKAINALDISARSPDEQNIQTAIKDEDLLIIYDGTRFWTQNMQPLSMADILQRAQHVKRIVLAVPPTLSFEAAMTVRTAIGNAPVIVTQLPHSWMERLGF